MMVLAELSRLHVRWIASSLNYIVARAALGCIAILAMQQRD
jgi:hypothetical protein